MMLDMFMTDTINPVCVHAYLHNVCFMIDFNIHKDVFIYVLYVELFYCISYPAL